MADSPDNKARRRRRLRQTFPAPLDQVAIRHVDTIQSLDGTIRVILAKAIAQTSMSNIPKYLAALKNSDGSIQSDTDLIALLDLAEPLRAEAATDSSSDEALGQTIEGVDLNYLASLLIKCYPDMPQSTVDALVNSNVLAPSLRVVVATRLALKEAKSDFIITALYTLFEQKLDEIAQIIVRNPSFTKAMQLSRPDWKPN
ncbi:MAG TPA: hypothetical protein VFG81_04005 [Anaerolineales bacterium]|jgi:hypothetical protein|nr:hypothetical protein [Anaerolineales bacterium]